MTEITIDNNTNPLHQYINADGQLDAASIPDNVTKIKVAPDAYVTSLVGAFNCEVDVNNNTNLNSVEGASFHGNANLNNCTSLASVVGATFNGIAFLRGCTSLTSVEGATFNGHSSLVGCTGLNSVNGATFNGTAILSGCTSLTSATGATFGATFNGIADLRGCTSLTSVEGATFNWIADLTDCTSLTSVEGATFNGFAILHGCTSLTSVEGATFNSSVSLNRCTSLTSVEGTTFNDNADLRGCTSLTSVEGTTFNDNADLRGCTSLISVEGARFNRNVSLDGCTSLTSLTGATFHGDVDLSRCTGLIPTPELISQLEGMEAQGKVVTWPEHFNRGNLIDDAKARLGTIVNTYKKTKPEGAPETLRLFNRFLGEGLGQRGGKVEVVESVTPFLEFIEKEPQNLSWIEERAKHYLQGCVNQPVAGFSEISAWAAIAKKTEIADKIEAARQLMALEEIKQFVAENSPGQGIEVEAGNALFREVHKQLVASGMKPWPGVPGSISYEGMLRNWLTDDKITDATIKVAESNAKPLSEVVDYLLNVHSLTWAQVAFPQKFTEITEKYTIEKEGLLELYSNNEPIADNYKPKMPDGTINNTPLTPDQRTEILNNASKSIELTKDSEIAETARKMTPDIKVSKLANREIKLPVYRDYPRPNKQSFVDLVSTKRGYGRDGACV